AERPPARAESEDAQLLNPEPWTLNPCHVVIAAWSRTSVPSAEGCFCADEPVCRAGQGCQHAPS
ncbi:MAG TPA: hypothetical protein PK867_17200, partial [Pirellulales bacterium]|nr:hypothetical protein [Pirellulales bacterium]